MSCDCVCYARMALLLIPLQISVTRPCFPEYQPSVKIGLVAKAPLTPSPSRIGSDLDASRTSILAMMLGCQDSATASRRPPPAPVPVQGVHRNRTLALLACNLRLADLNVHQLTISWISIMEEYLRTHRPGPPITHPNVPGDRVGWCRQNHSSLALHSAIHPLIFCL